MRMKLSQQTEMQVLFVGLIAVSVIVWGYFLSTSNLFLSEVFNFDLAQTIENVKSTGFILFVLLFPSTIGIVVVSCNFFTKREAQMSALAGSFMGFAVLLLLFPRLSEFAVAALFYLLGMWLMIETVYLKKLELKKWVQFRVTTGAAQRLASLTAIGLFIGTILFVFPQQETFKEQMEEKLLDIALQQQGTRQLNEYTADLMIENQKQTIERITRMPAYAALRGVEDQRVHVFLLGMDALETEMNSPEFREKVVAEIRKAQEGKIDKEMASMVFEKVKTQMPWYGFLTDYFWILSAFLATSVFLLLGNFVFRFLAVPYAMILEKVLIA